VNPAIPDVFHATLIPMSLSTLDEARFVEVNDAFCNLFGFPREALIGRTAFEVGLRDDPDERARQIARIRERGGGVIPEMLYTFSDGSRRFFDAGAALVRSRDEELLLLTLHDVTDRTRAREELAESEASARKLFADSPVPMWVWEPDDLRFLDVNHAAEQQYGYTREEFLALTALDIRPESERERIREVTSAPDELHHFGTWVHRRKDGSEFHAEVWSSIVTWHGKRARLSLCIDVTDRDQAERALREEQERSRRVLDNISDLVTLVGPDGTVVYASPSHEPVLGRAPDEFVGKSAFAFEDPADVRKSRDAFDLALQGQRPAPMRFRMTGKDGRLVQLEGTGWQPILDDAGRVVAVMGVSRDVTMRELVEEERRRAEDERRSLLARLVDAGEEERRRVADDVHDGPIQVLTALQLRLEALSPHVSDAGAPYMDKATEAVRDSIRSLRSLMFDLRPRILDREGLVAALRDQARVLSEETEIGVRVQGVALREEPSALMRTVLYRIAQEALTNVRKHAKASHVEIEVETTDEGTRLRVEDDGVGIPISSGATGGRLGLAAMRDRAELVGGTFRAEPRPVGGTIVEVVVPGGAEDYGVVDPSPRAPSADGTSPSRA
jgi:PAS domain S-box-containing protein